MCHTPWSNSTLHTETKKSWLWESKTNKWQTTVADSDSFSNFMSQLLLFPYLQLCKTKRGKYAGTIYFYMLLSRLLTNNSRYEINHYFVVSIFSLIIYLLSLRQLVLLWNKLSDQYSTGLKGLTENNRCCHRESINFVWVHLSNWVTGEWYRNPSSFFLGVRG